jgi:hypothetical protein
MFGITVIERRLREILAQPEHISISVTWSSADNDENYVFATKGFGEHCLVLETGTCRNEQRSLTSTQRSSLENLGWTSNRKNQFFLSRDVEINDEMTITEAASFILKTMMEGYALEASAINEIYERERSEEDLSEVSDVTSTDPTSSYLLPLGVVLLVIGVLAVGYGVIVLLNMFELQRLAEQGSVLEKAYLELLWKHGDLRRALDAMQKEALVASIGGMVAFGIGWDFLKSSRES